jgi:hypothetical protein
MNGYHQAKWVNNLRKATLRPKLGAILTVLDGDSDYMEGTPFCPATTAIALAERARAAGAGSQFSLAIVFLRQEYESMLITAGRQLTGLPAEIALPTDPENHPRDAKGWLSKNLPDGYHEASQQHELTQSITDWAPIRTTMRSFRRLEHALHDLVQAVANDSHIVSPQLPPPTPPSATE